MFYQSYSNILIKLRQPATFEPDNIRKSYISQKKAQRIWPTMYLYSGFSFGYITLSCVIWLKNDRLSKVDENIGIWLVKHFDLYLSLKLANVCIPYFKVKVDLQWITYFIVAKLSFLHTIISVWPKTYWHPCKSKFFSHSPLCVKVFT